MNAIVPTKQSPIEVMASRLHIDGAEVQELMISTLMKAKGNGQVTNAELVTFLSIANEYRLNPLTKEIHAFNNRGSIQAIVSIDGWLRIINEHPEFDGMEFHDDIDPNGVLLSVTCRIYRKDRSRPTEVTEYLNECRGTSEPWKKWPARMLRHKATIQAARYAFGLSGIIDEDEKDRYLKTNVGDQPIERDITPPTETSLPTYPQERFESKFPKFAKSITDGSQTTEEVIDMIETKYTLTDEQRQQIEGVVA